MRPTPPELNVADIALFLDVDGTLLEIRDKPHMVSADPDLIALLEKAAAALGGALSLISGRSLDDIDRIFSPVTFTVAGAHGAELRMLDGGMMEQPHIAMPKQVLRKLAEFVGERDGLLLEEKHGGASLHYRGAPELADECRRFVDGLLDELGDDYRLIAGKMVFEIAPSLHDKGEAVRIFMQSPPFSGRTPVFVGDDVTDEDGFRAANELGGISVLVGDRDDSAACHQLDDVASVRRWLTGSFDNQ